MHDKALFRLDAQACGRCAGRQTAPPAARPGFSGTGRAILHQHSRRAPHRVHGRPSRRHLFSPSLGLRKALAANMGASDRLKHSCATPMPIYYRVRINCPNENALLAHPPLLRYAMIFSGVGKQRRVCASFMAGRPPSVIRRQLVAEGSTLGDSPAPLASCQVGLRLTALSLILACSVRFAGLNAAGATTTCDWSTCSLQASTARTSDAVRARRGLASGEHERKGGGRSRHGLRRAEAHRPPQIRICLPHLPPRRRRSSTRAADASPAGARAPCASVAPLASSSTHIFGWSVTCEWCAVVLSVHACMYFSGLLAHGSSAYDVHTFHYYTHWSLIPASGRPTHVISATRHTETAHTPHTRSQPKVEGSSLETPHTPPPCGTPLTWLMSPSVGQLDVRKHCCRHGTLQ